MKSSSNFLKAFAGLFYPDICYACGSDLSGKNQLLCLRCLHQLPYTNFEKLHGNPVEKIFWGRLTVQNVASLLYFTKGSALEKLLYQLKYRGKKEVGHYCGRLMGQALRNSDLYKGIDAIIPLPLFRKKEHQRGFNQSRLLCEGMSEILQIPTTVNVIERIEATETQTRKNRVERWLNMEHRFKLLDESWLMNKHVLLVDDVITTGATLESCGQEILNVRSARLSIFTLAYSSSKNV
jgi:ComF family protein